MIVADSTPAFGTWRENLLVNHIHGVVYPSWTKSIARFRG
jgi:hypothetical protein